jgi:hypothetical protein
VSAVDVPRTLAGGLAANRALFGLGYVVRPELAGHSWVGRGARKPATRVMTRSQGIRDVALGGGALVALARGELQEARVWVACHALVDATDFVVTWSARDRLPRRGSRLALAVAGVSTAVAVMAAAGMRPPRTADPDASR